MGRGGGGGSRGGFSSGGGRRGGFSSSRGGASRGGGTSRSPGRGGGLGSGPRMSSPGSRRTPGRPPGPPPGGFIPPRRRSGPVFRPVIISTRKTVNQNGPTGDTGQARANGETAATRRRESWLPGWYVILMAVTAAVMILLLFQAASARSAAAGSVTREKLPASACVSSDQWLDDELDWITDQKTVTDAMQYFYDRTGVQPYLLIDDELAGKGESLTDAEAEDALVNLYDSLYRDDGHMIFAFIEYAPSEYLAYVYTGLAADSVVDANARGVFLGNVDRYYSDSSLTDEEFFAAVFRKTADTIMEDASGEASAATAYAVLCAALFIVMVGGLFLFKRREQSLREKDQLKEILSAPISSPEEQELEKKYGDGAPPTV